MTAFDPAAQGLRPWVWRCRDIDLVEYDGQIDGYHQAYAEIMDGDVGEWKLTLPLVDPEGMPNLSVPILLTPGAGVVVRPDGMSDVLFSGPVSHDEITYSADGDSVTFTGPTDEFELASDVAWPDPTHWLNDVAGNNVISGTVDARTGPAETVLLAYVKANMGSTAFHSGATTPPIDRRRPYLQIPASLGRGTTGSYQANFDALLDIARTICRTGGITWRIMQGAAGDLDLSIRLRDDVSADVVFSRAEGSLTNATFAGTAPTVNEAVAVNDTGSARSYAVSIDTAAQARWGRKFVTYVDGGTAVIADLLKAADDAIAGGIETAGASVEAVVIPGGPQFGVDYFLGDRVSVVDADGFAISDFLKQMTYDHGKDGGPTLVPSVGFALTDQDSALVPILRDLTAQLRALTRRRP